MRRRLGVGVIGLLLVSTFPLRAATQPNLEPIIERLGSSAVRDRISALRDLGRMKPPVDKIRPVLEKMVTDPSPEVRAEVVWAVAELIGPSGTDLLEKLYADPDRTVRDGAIRSACRQWSEPRPRELCKGAFADPDYGARVEVIGALKDGFARDPGAAEIFRAGLKDPSEMVQRAAIFGAQAARDGKAVAELGRIARTGSDLVAEPAAAEALATIGTPEAVKELLALLPRPKGEPGKPARPTDRVRAAAARALARIKDPKTLPALRELVKDPNSTVRIGAIDGITEMKDREAVPVLLPLLSDKETRIRQFTLRALRLIGDPSAADAIRKVMREDKEKEVRSTAVVTLADLLGAKAIPEIAAVKDDLAAEVRFEAAGALGGLGTEAGPALAGFLKDASQDVRVMAIRNLGQVGGPSVIPALADAAKDADRKNQPVRLAVAEALGGIGHVNGLPALTRLAADAEPNVRQGAATALGRIGGDKAKKVLEGLLKDKVAGVRNAARRALDGAKK